jgi:hypothetical protein
MPFAAAAAPRFFASANFGAIAAARVAEGGVIDGTDAVVAVVAEPCHTLGRAHSPRVRRVVVGAVVCLWVFGSCARATGGNLGWAAGPAVGLAAFPPVDHAAGGVRVDNAQIPEPGTVHQGRGTRVHMHRS